MFQAGGEAAHNRACMPLTLDPPTLAFVGVAVVLLAAGAMTWFGLRERHYRGYWWWVAAQWLLLAGFALRWAWPEQANAQLAAGLLTLQWPLAVLTGLRRFYSRHGLPLPAAADAALFGLAALALPLAAALRAAPQVLAGVEAAGLIAAPLYAAVLVTRLSEFRESAALPTLCAAFVGQGLAQAAVVWGPTSPPQRPCWRRCWQRWRWRTQRCC